MNERNVEALVGLLNNSERARASYRYPEAWRKQAEWLLDHGVSVAPAGEPTGPRAEKLSRMREAFLRTFDKALSAYGEWARFHSTASDSEATRLAVVSETADAAVYAAYDEAVGVALRLAGDGAPSGEGP